VDPKEEEKDQNEHNCLEMNIIGKELHMYMLVIWLVGLKFQITILTPTIQSLRVVITVFQYSRPGLNELFCS
jgi:hypothetical protein